jgi:GNAT superfamily N-acetyltransferase
MSAGPSAVTLSEERLARMARSIQAWQRVLGEAAADGAVLEVGELVGSIVPAAPSRSILNAAAAPRGAALGAEVLEELGAHYAGAGITAWGVWVHADDAAAVTALEEAGATIDSRPAAMAIDLAALAPAPGSAHIGVEQTRHLELLAEPLSGAYGFPAALLTRGLPALLHHGEGWIARVDGVPAAAAVIVRAGDDAGVFLVGTAPPLRGQGAASAALHAALLHAREQGCTTSTLQASAMGRPVYARMGYAELGEYLLLERREGGI